MSYSRVVWLEPQPNGKDEEYEMTVPSNWIKGSSLFYPHHLNVRRSFKNRAEPSNDWHCFQIVKIKLHKGILAIYYKSS